MSRRGRFSGWVWGLLFDNFWLKLTALVAALGFYAFINLAKPSTEKFEVRLRLEDPLPSSGKARKVDLLPVIWVEVKGPAPAVKQIDQRDLFIELNLTDGQDEEIELVESLISLPPRVHVTRFIPPVLKFRFEDIINREIKVQVSRTGELAKDMEVKGAIVIEPETVIATGITSLVDTVQFARADAFDVTGLEEGRHTRNLKLDRPPEGVRYDHADIMASIDVIRQLAEKEFEQVTVEVIGLPRSRTKPATVSIKITGTPDEVAKINADLIVPQVDPTKGDVDLSQPGSANFTVVVNLPNVQVEVVPATVLVKW
jgi:hypothetical protein